MSMSVSEYRRLTDDHINLNPGNRVVCEYGKGGLYGGRMTRGARSILRFLHGRRYLRISV